MKIVTLSKFATGEPKKPPSLPIGESQRPKKKTTLDPSDIITVDLSSIVDLNRIHLHINHIFNAKKDLVKHKQEAFDSISNAPTETIEEELLNERYMDSIFRDIESLENELEGFEEYFNLAPLFLELYTSMLPTQTNRVVGENEIVINPENAQNFTTIVMQFVELAMRFTTKIKIINKCSTIERCECGGSTVIVDGIVFCASCNSKVKTKEGGSGSSGYGSDYYRSETFEEGLDNIEGRPKKPIPPYVYEAITKYCDSLGISEENLAKEELIDILKRERMSEYYKLINLIRHTIQGRKLPSYQHIRGALLERHRLIEGEYISIRKNEDRNNFLNVYFVIRACIQMEGQPVNPDDFIVLTTVDALKNHNRIMHIICDRIRTRQATDKTIRGSWDFISIMN